MTGRARTAAIVVAGGRGERFGRDGGKQLALAFGLPVLSWAVKALVAAPEVEVLIIVRPEELAETYEREALQPVASTLPLLFASAGETRQESVRSGLERLPDWVDVVVVHDGARPLVTPDTVSGALRTLFDTGSDGVVVAHPSFDTLKVVSGGLVLETPERSRFWQVQTPQVFKREVLQKAHEAAEKTGFAGTDDASLVERDGGKVMVFEGSRDNIKVTMPEDLAYVEAVLRQRDVGVR